MTTLDKESVFIAPARKVRRGKSPGFSRQMSTQFGEQLFPQTPHVVVSGHVSQVEEGGSRPPGPVRRFEAAKSVSKASQTASFVV